MRRHGWTFCLGLLVGGPALAQPPADTERFPPAPDLPGVVVSQPAGGRPVATAGPVSIRSSSYKPSDAPAPLPLPAVKSSPYLPVATVVSAQVATPVVKPVAEFAPCAPAAACAAPACGGGGHGNVMDWLCFRSQVRDWGCVPKKYVPPLQAWFPCTPKAGCSTCAPPIGIPFDAALPAGKPGSMIEGTEPPPAPPKRGDGLSFDRGAAPMAAPTTQTGIRSSWKPK